MRVQLVATVLAAMAVGTSAFLPATPGTSACHVCMDPVTIVGGNPINKKK